MLGGVVWHAVHRLAPLQQVTLAHATRRNGGSVRGIIRAPMTSVFMIFEVAGLSDPRAADDCQPSEALRLRDTTSGFPSITNSCAGRSPPAVIESGRGIAGRHRRPCDAQTMARRPRRITRPRRDGRPKTRRSGADWRRRTGETPPCADSPKTRFVIITGMPDQRPAARLSGVSTLCWTSCACCGRSSTDCSPPRSVWRIASASPGRSDSC